MLSVPLFHDPCCSEKKLRRLEDAAELPRLSKLALGRILSLSESRWESELHAAQAGGEKRRGEGGGDDMVFWGGGGTKGRGGALIEHN